ncbi:MAG: hypothetical protein JSV05_07825 [Candidatus Bathyarchaeota archaeon]|nr:MAG: hypothetical protein JSV05_07825 [Candidatus Bathyarchaeota archaeon]
MVDLQMISVILAASGLLVGATYYILILRNAEKTRRTQLFMNIYNRFYDREFQKCYLKMLHNEEWNSFEEWWGKYGPSNLEHYSGWMAWGTYFAGIAMLVKQGQIDPQQVSDLLGTYILWSWERYKSIFKEIRARSEVRKRPQLSDWLEYLYHEMKKVEPSTSL